MISIIWSISYKKLFSKINNLIIFYVKKNVLITYIIYILNSDMTIWYDILWYDTILYDTIRYIYTIFTFEYQLVSRGYEYNCRLSRVWLLRNNVALFYLNIAIRGIRKVTIWGQLLCGIVYIIFFFTKFYIYTKHILLYRFIISDI